MITATAWITVRASATLDGLGIYALPVGAVVINRVLAMPKGLAIAHPVGSVLHANSTPQLGPREGHVSAINATVPLFVKQPRAFKNAYYQI